MVSESARGLSPLFRRLAWVTLLVLLPVAALFTTLDVLGGKMSPWMLALPLMLTGGNVGLMARDRRLRSAPPAVEAPVLSWTVRVENPAPGQCPVCGFDDLPYWREADEWSLREGDERHVVEYGKHEAHRSCADLVPYVEPPAGRLSDRSGAGFDTIETREALALGRYTIARGDGTKEIVEIVRGAEVRPGTWVGVLASPLRREAKVGAELWHVDGQPSQVPELTRKERLAADIRGIAEDLKSNFNPITGSMTLGFCWTCRYCRNWGRCSDKEAAATAQIEHARTCAKRQAVRAGE